MKTFVLDTNVLIRDPSLLARVSDEIHFVIPDAVLLELSSSKSESVKQTLALIWEALDRGVSRIPSINSVGKPAKGITIPEVGFADWIIVRSVEEFIKSLPTKDAQRTFFVTQDRDLADYGRTVGINVIDIDALMQELSKTPITNKKISEHATEIIVQQKREYKWLLLSNIVTGIVVSVVANAGYTYFGKIISTVNIWGTIVALPLLGFLLFWLRSKFRLNYGIAELLFGLVTSLRVFVPSFDYSNLNAVGILQALAGIYVMVRGLDNIDHGFKGTRFEEGWRRIFR